MRPVESRHAVARLRRDNAGFIPGGAARQVDHSAALDRLLGDDFSVRERLLVAKDSINASAVVIVDQAGVHHRRLVEHRVGVGIQHDGNAAILDDDSPRGRRDEQRQIDEDMHAVDDDLGGLQDGRRRKPADGCGALEMAVAIAADILDMRGVVDDLAHIAQLLVGAKGQTVFADRIESRPHLDGKVFAVLLEVLRIAGQLSLAGSQLQRTAGRPRSRHPQPCTSKDESRLHHEMPALNEQALTLSARATFPPAAGTPMKRCAWFSIGRWARTLHPRWPKSGIYRDPNAEMG